MYAIILPSLNINTHAHIHSVASQVPSTGFQHSDNLIFGWMNRVMAG